MSTVTKKELVDSIVVSTGLKRQDVKDVVQRLLDGVVVELGKGNRIELRDFGVFEVRVRKERIAQNPKQPEIKVKVPERSVIKFKMGRLMRESMSSLDSSKES